MTTPHTGLRKAILAVTLGLAALHSADAHYLWIERSGTEATVFFGEFEESARERSPGRLDEMPGPRAQVLTDKAATSVDLRKRADGFVFASPGEAAQALVVEERGVEVKDWTRSGLGIVKPIFYARHQPLGGAVSGMKPALTLDILPQAEPGSFRVYFQGKALPKAEVKVVAPNTWAQDGRTDDTGLVRLPLPWKGQYVVQVIHLEPGSGEFEGKPYQARRHRATLTFVNDSGDATFTAKRESTLMK